MVPPEIQAARLAHFLRATLREARGVVERRNRVDLAIMKWHVGRLCAACLDLPPAEGRALRSALVEVLAELDALTDAVTEAGP